MRYLYIRDWYGSLLAYSTYDETQNQVSGVRVPETIPGEFEFILTSSLGGRVKVPVYLRYYTKGYVGCGDTAQLLRVTYPRGQETAVPDQSGNFTVYIMTTNPTYNYFSLKVNGDLWRVTHSGVVDSLYIGSETNPLIKVHTTTPMSLEFNLPIENTLKIWGVSSSSTTQPDIFADVETAVTLADQETLNVIFTTVPTDAIFIDLYQNTAASTIVDKSTYLTAVDTLPGVLRKQCSVSDPIITIQYDRKPEANYCYIEKFKRYYYINDYVNIAQNLWEMYLKSDPLYSFKAEYLNSLVTILRSSSSAIYNRLYHDNLMPVPNKLTRTRIYGSGTPLTPNIGDDGGFSINTAHIVLSVFCDTDVQNNVPSGQASPTAPGSIINYGYYYPRGAQAYAIDRLNLNNLARVFANGGPEQGGFSLDKIFGTDDLTPYVISLRAYPINFRALLNDTCFKSYTVGTSTNPSITLACGKITLERAINVTPVVVAGYPLVPVYPTLEFGTIVIPTPTSFLDTEPNSRAILHLPYIGDIDFDLTEYAGLTIKITYILDVNTGNVKALIKNNADESILFSQSGKMGVDIPMILNNMTKGESERTGHLIKLGTSIASATAGIIGTAAGSPIAGGIIGGAVSLVGNTIATPYFNTPVQAKQFASGDMTDFYTDQKAYLEIIKPEDNYTLFYAREYGIPANKIINLSDNDVSGFTVVSPNSRITHPAEATLNEYEEICSALKSGVVI